MNFPENAKSVFISYGEQVKMYTLHVVYETDIIGQDGLRYVTTRSVYIKNLSTEREKAIDKAVEYAASKDIEFVSTDNSRIELHEILRRERNEQAHIEEEARQKRIQEQIDLTDKMVIVFDEQFESDKFTFGKYNGIAFNEVRSNDPNYIKYILGNSNEELPKEFPRTVNEVCLNSLYEYIEKEGYPRQPEDDSEYVGQKGERIDVNVTVTKAVSFDTQFGIKVMYTFIDVNNNVFVTFYSGHTWSLKTGESAIIKGTVDKHDVYGTVKQTHLKRVKVL